ncbi:unnamed protein product [Phytophthora fragariaefolia]|uniref:Unnamed protein product n=1 Tax=Phytophthora fragariaefolia TaxID=1490495 RepID=A0A9W7CSJ2_9STRA|nr:unnamed protein product [Phytophthora fragariaefolia]
MVSGFWIVPMTDRARLISTFITPLGLFEWLRMPFGLCNAPQIYQRLIDNTLYGFLRLSPGDATRDVFGEEEPVRPGIHSVLAHRSYLDDILIGGTSWDDLCENVERLLDVCEQWHLAISVEKGEWGMSQGHKDAKHGLRANPKNLESLTALELPRALKGLRSFLGWSTIITSSYRTSPSHQLDVEALRDELQHCRERDLGVVASPKWRVDDDDRTESTRLDASYDIGMAVSVIRLARTAVAMGRGIATTETGNMSVCER